LEKRTGRVQLPASAAIYWEKLFEGKPKKMAGFSVSLIATKIEGEPCVWRADTAHGYAHEHQMWNGRIVDLHEKTGDLTGVYEKCLRKAVENCEKFLAYYERASREGKIK